MSNPHEQLMTRWIVESVVSYEHDRSVLTGNRPPPPPTLWHEITLRLQPVGQTMGQTVVPASGVLILRMPAEGSRRFTQGAEFDLDIAPISSPRMPRREEHQR